MNITKAFKKFVEEGKCIRRKVWQKEYFLRPDPRYKNRYQIWYPDGVNDFDLSTEDILATDWEIDKKQSTKFEKTNLSWM